MVNVSTNNSVSYLIVINEFIQEIFNFNLRPNIDTPHKADMIRDKTILIKIILFIYLTLVGVIFFKLLLIFIYFFLFHFIKSIIEYFKYIISVRFDLRLKTSPRGWINYILRNLRKFYTYNFYSFESNNIIFGTVIIILLFIFLISNLVLAYINYASLTDERVLFTYFCSFQSHIYMQIFCFIFYQGKSLKNAIIVTLKIFFLMNFLILFFSIFGYIFQENDKVTFLLRVWCRIIFLAIIISINLETLRNLKRTNYFDESWDLYFREKQKLLSNFNFYLSSDIISNEKNFINKIDKENIFIRNVYCDSFSPYFLTRRNRFYYIKILRFAFALYLLLFLVDLCLTSVQLIFNQELSRDVGNKEGYDILIFVSFFHMINNIMLCSFTFMKIEIKTLVLY